MLKNIFGHLLPPTTKSIRTFELRYTRLRPLALVSKSWGAIARALLLERVYLPAWQQCAKFRKTMDGESSSGMGRLTTELRIGQVEPTGNLLLKHPQFVPRVLVQTPFVTSLWLEEVMIDPADLSVLKGESSRLGDNSASSALNSPTPETFASFISSRSPYASLSPTTRIFGTYPTSPPYTATTANSIRPAPRRSIPNRFSASSPSPLSPTSTGHGTRAIPTPTSRV